ncbi:MAG: hypothetical protein D4R64_13765 [Porphyromonadaceae bacterium]|nr:MAG: hypothetical protein D4R64_13765 [Porphyromonadaceae bacterium]
MADYSKNPFIRSRMLPVDVVFHPSWWNKHAGIVFDEDFFYHPLKRVEAEKKMENVLYERFGQFGLGENRNQALPVIGAVHNAAGYIIQEMLGCKVIYQEDSPPQVISAGMGKLDIDPLKAFNSDVFKKLLNLQEQLKSKYGYLTGDINWGGVLNIALDLIGEKVFTDFYLEPDETKKQFRLISDVIERFASCIASLTGTTSISVNRNVRHIEHPVFLHSECTHTMISTGQYEEFLMPIDIVWSQKYRPFGIHYCGKDPHRYAESFSKISNLNFLDVGWGGDIKELRKFLPHTFLNIRLDPVSINSYTDDDLEKTITNLVTGSGNPYLTGVCCINMDDKVEDGKIATIFRTVEKLRVL